MEGGQVRASVGSPSHVLSAPNSEQNRCGAQSYDVRPGPTAVILQVRPARSATVRWPMASKSKPKPKPQKQAPLEHKAEPVQQAVPDAPAPLFSVGDAEHHPMFGDGKVEQTQENKVTSTFNENVNKENREDIVTTKQ